MSDIFDEVEEDLRRARFEALWSKYWPSILTVAVIVIAGVGGWRFYDWQQEQNSAAAGARFEAAMRASRTDGAEAEKQFAAIATDAPSGYRILARFRQATELAVRDKDGAVKAFDALAADPAIGPLLQDVARVRAAYLLVDTAPQAEIVRRMEPLAGPAQAYRHSAREALALAAMRANDKAGAERWLQAIQLDTETPQGVRGRAELIASIVAGLGN
jgi:hypothetical protein